jgi:RNA polymerase-binding transcription factor DksA
MKTPFPAPSPAPAIPARWRWHYRALLALRDELRAGSATRETALRVAREAGGNDFTDVAVDEEEDRLAVAELGAEAAELAEVEAALGRLAAGTYGRCAETGRPIAAARLRALPWTRWSAAAAARREKAAAPVFPRKNP